MLQNKPVSDVPQGWAGYVDSPGDARGALVDVRELNKEVKFD